MRHDLLKKMKAVELRHANIQSHNIRNMLDQQFPRDVGIWRRADNFNLRIRRQDFCDQGPNNGRVVDNKNFYFPAGILVHVRHCRRSSSATVFSS